MRTLDEFRAQFPITRSRAYLFNGALAPAAVAVRAALDGWAETWSCEPLVNYGRYESDLALVRGSFARLVGASPAEIAVLDSTSTGSNLAVELLALRPGGNVLVDETTYPSSLYPWSTQSGLDVRFVSTSASEDPSARLAEHVDSATVAINVSHVAPFTGRRHNLRTLAEAVHAVGGVLVVDAAQTAGVTPIDVASDGVDILVTTAMKWLLGTPGLGFLYARRELLDDAQVRTVGHSSLTVPWEHWPVLDLPPLHAGARRLEVGVPSLPGLAATHAGIELLLDVGVHAISKRVEELTGRCLEGLAERGFAVTTPMRSELRGGVMVFDHPRPLELAAHLRLRGVDIGAYAWGPVRVDPHGFNNELDIGRFLDELDGFRTG